MARILELLKKRDENGFTLIELLIAIAIIAIIAAIAIPRFSAYRERAIRASMIADAKNTATNAEAVFGDCQDYPASLTIAPGSSQPFSESSLGGMCTGVTTTVTFVASRGNTITITKPSANSYQIRVCNKSAGDGWPPLTLIGGAGTDSRSCNFKNGSPC